MATGYNGVSYRSNLKIARVSSTNILIPQMETDQLHCSFTPSAISLWLPLATDTPGHSGLPTGSPPAVANRGELGGTP